MAKKGVPAEFLFKGDMTGSSPWPTEGEMQWQELRKTTMVWWKPSRQASFSWKGMRTSSAVAARIGTKKSRSLVVLGTEMMHQIEMTSGCVWGSVS